MTHPPTAQPSATSTDANRGSGLHGHVFVVRGRLESVASDALIVPTSASFVPRETWWRALGIDTEPPRTVGNHEDRVRRFPPRTEKDRPAWLLDVAHDGWPSVPWLVDGLKAALREIEANRPHLGDGRVRPLIALPTIGVGLGGYEGVRGKVIKAVLATAQEFVGSSVFDVVFVVENAADYAAFQSIRRERTPAPESSRSLARTIRRGDVALLLGAGVSISAGLPTWDALLKQLKDDTLSDLDDDEFAKLGVLDRAQLLSKASGDKTLGQRAADATGAGVSKLPTLSHCLLASLAVTKAVTTNYDTLYEDAFRAANGPKSIRVLPRQEAESARAWLLKMHGDVAAPDSIVLSRRDFVRYDAERRPLGSIVQSLMATSHLIVIGASMTDDNVLRLAHEVLAMNDKNKHTRSLGTVVTLQTDPLRTALWEGDFDYLAASVSKYTNVAARDLEILLDGVAMHASDRSPFLLDPRYGELLSEQENDIAAALHGVATQIRELPTHQAERWRPLHKSLIAMGAVATPPLVRDKSVLTLDDVVDAYFSASKHENFAAEIRDYHFLKRDILVALFDCPLPERTAVTGDRNSQHDRDSVSRIARSSLKQASALSNPFGYYLEGGPGPLENAVVGTNRRALESANDALLHQYRKIFVGALASLYPGIELETFPRSLLFERGLPTTEPTLDPLDF